MLRKLTASSVCMAVAAFAGLSMPALSPASGIAPDGRIHVDRRGVLYEGCNDVDYSWSINLPYGAASWSMTVTLEGPDGTEVDSDYEYDNHGGYGSGSFQICDWEEPGRYYIDVDASYLDEDYDERFLWVDAPSFSMKRPKSRTQISVHPTRNLHRGQLVTMKVTSRGQKPYGYFRLPYVNVVIQVRHGSGAWRNIRWTKSITGRNGTATIRGKYTGRVAVRARTVGGGAYKSSNSRVIHLR
ncbi:hypothetical protein [Nocardioides soli]|uniref:Uncharacterized protein n=1 Tax=Nocardioides soli TaxID=1036020 RepID=A0A7W4Z2T2_9ACTN|nr:hypothetical protein [Nocardioides soli]MBB3044222.1 hypothetical protein [Nocardioides soli]